MHRINVVQLDDGAVVAFQEYGDRTGTPVIFCHGWPSSCTMAQLTDEAARALGIRIISPDRPGISGSSVQLDRKLSDWPSVVKRLLDELEIGEFRILAISGGAPYAYAAAVAAPVSSTSRVGWPSTEVGTCSSRTLATIASRSSPARSHLRRA